MAFGNDDYMDRIEKQNKALTARAEIAEKGLKDAEENIHKLRLLLSATDWRHCSQMTRYDIATEVALGEAEQEKRDASKKLQD